MLGEPRWWWADTRAACPGERVSRQPARMQPCIVGQLAHASTVGGYVDGS